MCDLPICTAAFMPEGDVGQDIASLHSLLRQDFDGFEVQIACKRGELPYLDEFIKTDGNPCVTYVEIGYNSMLPLRLNAVLRSTKARFVMVAMAPDISSTNRMGELVSKALMSNKIGVVGSPIKTISSSGQTTGWITPSIDLDNDGTQATIDSRKYMIENLNTPFRHRSILFQCAVVSQFGGYSTEKPGVDAPGFDLFSRVISSNYLVSFVNKPLLSVRPQYVESELDSSKSAAAVIAARLKLGRLDQKQTELDHDQRASFFDTLTSEVKNA